MLAYKNKNEIILEHLITKLKSGFQNFNVSKICTGLSTLEALKFSDLISDVMEKSSVS